MTPNEAQRLWQAGYTMTHVANLADISVQAATVLVHGSAARQARLEREHWHVHTHLGGGYLCSCDRHYPLTAAERDEALRDERDAWQDFKWQGERPQDIRITGSVRSGHFTITDTASIAWERYVDAFKCSEAECLKEDE
jgi:hypothetical protein